MYVVGGGGDERWSSTGLCSGIAVTLLHDFKDVFLAQFFLGSAFSFADKVVTLELCFIVLINKGVFVNPLNI